MTFSLNFNRTGGEFQNIVLEPGEILFVVGANGTGKSSLMQSFAQQTHNRSRRILAHRQTWFTSNTLDLTPQSKRNAESNMAQNDINVHSRYRDDYASQRASMTIFDLIDAQNVRARSIAFAVDSENMDEARALSLKEAPLKAINSLLQQSNIPIEIDVIQNEQIVARKNGGMQYSVAELSDGERNALLIAGDVLTAKPDSLLIIDEPERHLHRSIISPLLSLLFAKRSDCSFIVATHDVELPLDNETSKTLLIRSATYQYSNVQSWEADLLEPGSPISDEIKRDVIGSRRRILFVEGKEESLDKPLYSLIFPMVSIIAKESCKAVEQSVMGLSATSSLTWVSSWGIVDGDSQSDQRIEDLKERSIFAVPFYSVESIYYHPWVLNRVIERVAKLTKADAVARNLAAIEVGVSRVQQNKQRLVLKAATKAARDEVLNQLPTVPSVTAGTPIHISVDVAQLIAAKEADLEAKIASRDWLGIVTTCSIRESGALDPMSKAAGLPSTKDYQAAVRTMIAEDDEALAFVRSLFADAYQKISTALA